MFENMWTLWSSDPWCTLLVLPTVGESAMLIQTLSLYSYTQACSSEASHRLNPLRTKFNPRRSQPQPHHGASFSCPTFRSFIVCIQRQCHSWRISQVSQQMKYSTIGCCTLFSFPSVCRGVRGSWPQLEDELSCTTPLCHGVQEGSKWHWETPRLRQMGSLQPRVTLHVQKQAQSLKLSDSNVPERFEVSCEYCRQWAIFNTKNKMRIIHPFVPLDVQK